MTAPAASDSRPDLRMLVLSVAGAHDVKESRRLAAEGLQPDGISAEEALGAASLDDRDVALVGGLRGRLLKTLPAHPALALEAWWRRGDYDVMLTWGEHVAFPLALLMALTPRRRCRHIAILMWPFNNRSPSRLRRIIKRLAYRLLARHGMDRLSIPAPRQRRFAMERWGIPPERLLTVQWPIDTHFWHPMEGAGDVICSAGVEMRDYPTLLAALGTLDIPCRIAGGTSVMKPSFMPDDAQVRGLEAGTLPENVTVGSRSPTELRELYARSRFVVVPVMPSESDNGVTVVAEAMAMGRALITTATEGGAEILSDGVNCVLVPPRDTAAMRAAIEQLWNDPERCAKLAAAGREQVVAAHGIDQWVAGILATVSELADGQ